MNTYQISETQGMNSVREATTHIARSLTAAKRKATTMQQFQNTWLYIEDNCGNLLARKPHNGKWEDIVNF